MGGISIEIPAIDAEQSIEIEVKVNGKRKHYIYRVEIFSWDECEEVETKASCLKNKIEEYDKDWQLIHIGCASKKNIPLMFRQKN